MGFKLRRILWLVAVFIIFSMWATYLEEEFRSGMEIPENSGTIGALILTFITAKILFKLIVKRWILAGIRNDEELQRALKHGWVRKYYKKQERKRIA